MDEFASLQQRLPDAWAANRVGSEVPHVVVALPSFSLGETVLAHYATRIPALEHRYLLAAQMLPRIPGCHLIFLACRRPEEEVLAYYARIAGADGNSLDERLQVFEVPDESPRPVAKKLLDRPDLIEDLHRLIGGRPAMIEPWNVTEHEVELALRLGVPVNGTSPQLWPLGFKSAGRKLFERAGVPVPLGREDIHDLTEAAAAIDMVRTEHPAAAGVVIKLDNSGAGDGNHVVRFSGPATELQQVPPWFIQDLLAGGVVEELIDGERCSSPSVQVDISPDGEVAVLSTHEQVLGGDNAQVYTGCTFPAAAEYAPLLAVYGEAVGRELARMGVLGRLAVDFVAVRTDGSWAVYALEVNLRKGGTTHPYCLLRHLAPGRYDAATGTWVTEDGTTRHYRSTDNLVDEAWLGLPAADVIDAVAAAGLEWDAARGSGVVLHMLSCLAVDGRVGLTALAKTGEEADALYAATREAIDSLVKASAAVS